MVVLLSAATGAAAARGGPPPIDASRLPADAAPAPPDPTEQRNTCFHTAVREPEPVVPAAQRWLNLEPAWRFTKGAGQLVAVIDTGVSRSPRLPGLIAGGDYVGTSDGTVDCDVHGTAVAGIIAASEADGDGFAGVAPQARIISLRQSSGLFDVAGRSPGQRDDQIADGYGNVATMASAVRHAADMGATVINISEVACSTAHINDAALGAAVQYAATVRNAVVIAAAGNTDRCSAANPGPDPLHPNADPWDRITTAVSPARFDDYVLTVGSVDAHGAASKFTVAGPWVDVAAPGENIVSLDARGAGTATGKRDDKGNVAAFSGTSFAAPFVAGTAALVRARFPQLTAREVINRIAATAHKPAEGWNPYVGNGVIDPYAALTAEVAPTTASDSPRTLPSPPAESADRSAQYLALGGSAAVAVLLGLGVLASLPLARASRRSVR
ncbi:type VII secretion-associated serine protease mycosin [Skermania sp. ID1734]|nr:type VII secretion-associated serine protease mycosin [Skermania sp. ID1734]